MLVVYEACNFDHRAGLLAGCTPSTVAEGDFDMLNKLGHDRRYPLADFCLVLDEALAKEKMAGD